MTTAASISDKFRASATSLSALPAEQILAVIDHLAKNPPATEDKRHEYVSICDALSTNPRYRVKEALAQGLYLSDEAQVRVLQGDNGRDPDIMELMASNPTIGTPAQDLIFIRGGHSAVAALAQNLNVSDEVQIMIAQNGSVLARSYLAANPNVSGQAAEILKQDDEGHVQEAIAATLDARESLPEEQRPVLEAIGLSLQHCEHS